jgi:gas vesicle protein
MTQNNSNGGGVGWLFAGLGIGALLGFLYAPKSGKETRESLAANAQEARDRGNKMYAQGERQAGQYIQQGRDALNQYIEKGKDLLQTHSDALSAAVDAGKQAYVQKSSETPQS